RRAGDELPGQRASRLPFHRLCHRRFHGNKCSASHRWWVVSWRSSTIRGEHSMSRLATAGRNRWIALAVIVAAQCMVVLAVAIVKVALLSIKTDLGFTQESRQWVITAYAIMFGGVLLLGGRMADLLGRRRLFIAGLILFPTASLLSGLAW